MIKENKDFFLYVLGIVVLSILTMVLFSYIFPGQKKEECGFLGINCWLDNLFKKEMAWSEPPEMIIDTNKDYKAVVKTNFGDFELDLYEENAPLSVNSFVFLASENYYDNVRFHRVARGFLVQTGDRNTLDSDPDNDGEGGPGYVFQDEINWESLNFSKAKIQQLSSLGFTSKANVISRHLEHKSVAMANSGPDTNGSQFFIVTSASGDSAVKGLEGRHTTFGKVISGWEVIEAIENVEVDDPTSSSPRPQEDITILDIEIQES